MLGPKLSSFLGQEKRLLRVSSDPEVHGSAWVAFLMAVKSGAEWFPRQQTGKLGAAQQDGDDRQATALRFLQFQAWCRLLVDSSLEVVGHFRGGWGWHLCFVTTLFFCGVPLDHSAHSAPCLLLTQRLLRPL